MKRTRCYEVIYLFISYNGKTIVFYLSLDILRTLQTYPKKVKGDERNSDLH